MTASYSRRVAYDEGLAERVREIVSARAGVVEKKMFGGVCWMIGDHMGCGVLGDELFVRHDKEETDAVMREPHTRRFEMRGGRVMSGFVVVAPEALGDDADLARWVDRGADYAATLPPK